jgi:hypothetical protein
MQSFAETRNRSLKFPAVSMVLCIKLAWAAYLPGRGKSTLTGNRDGDTLKTSDSFSGTAQDHRQHHLKEHRGPQGFKPPFNAAMCIQTEQIRTKLLVPRAT